MTDQHNGLPETRKRPGNDYKDSVETIEMDMKKLTDSMRRLLQYCEDDPIGFGWLVEGRTDHVDEQLVSDLKRVQEEIRK